jgi:hypothetical protein
MKGIVSELPKGVWAGQFDNTVPSCMSLNGILDMRGLVTVISCTATAFGVGSTMTDINIISGHCLSITCARREFDLAIDIDVFVGATAIARRSRHGSRH